MLGTKFIIPLLAIWGVGQGHRIGDNAHKLHVDVYHAAAEPVTYQNSTNLEFSPTTFTLIHGAHEAVLVDAPASINHSHQLADWIEATLNGKRLSSIYITHGHGDHFLGSVILRQRFPGVKLYATPGTIQHIEEELDPQFMSFYWDSLFPGQIPDVSGLEFLPVHNTLYLEGHELRAVEVGQGDIMNATVLHVPELSLVVTGDVVYGNCFQMFEETNTTTLQDAWIQAIEKIEALKPAFVIPSHMQPDEKYGTSHLSRTKRYIVDWKGAVKRARVWQDVEASMKRLYPNRVGSFILRVSAQTPFNAIF